MKMSRNAWSSHDEIGCGAAILIALLLIGLLFLGPVITMWLWNWIAVELFALPYIGYWQAFGLQWLCHILFGHTVTVRSKS